MKAKSQKPKAKSRKKYSYPITTAVRDQRSAAGSVTSRKKARASRENAKKGGRPGNPEIARIMREKGVTRQRAHQILNEKGST